MGTVTTVMNYYKYSSHLLSSSTPYPPQTHRSALSTVATQKKHINNQSIRNPSKNMNAVPVSVHGSYIRINNQLVRTHHDNGHEYMKGDEVSVEVIQQPGTTQVAIAGKEKLRKPVDPPPFIKLSPLSNASASTLNHLVNNPNLFSLIQLLYANDRTLAPGEFLRGQIVSSIFKLNDTEGNEGGYFIFGDLYINSPGEYILRVIVQEVRCDGFCHYIDEVFTQAFQVVQPKYFKGLLASTLLSRTFTNQGLRLRARKDLKNKAKDPKGKKRKASSLSTELDPDSALSDVKDDPDEGVPPPAPAPSRRKTRAPKKEDEAPPSFEESVNYPVQPLPSAMESSLAMEPEHQLPLDSELDNAVEAEAPVWSSQAFYHGTGHEPYVFPEQVDFTSSSSYPATSKYPESTTSPPASYSLSTSFTATTSYAMDNEASTSMFSSTNVPSGTLEHDDFSLAISNERYPFNMPTAPFSQTTTLDPALEHPFSVVDDSV